MNFWVKLYEILNVQMTEPTSYGWFHLMFIAIVVAASVILCLRFRDCEDKVFRRIALVSWIVILALEIYKQYNYTGSVEEGALVWDYQWYIFPYQFCSTPLYALPFIAFSRPTKLRDAFVAFMSFFSLFAGIAVFCYPNDVFIETVGINIQTMVHHGLQIVLGIYFTAYMRKRYEKKLYFSGAIVFVAFVAIAMVANVIGYKALSSVGSDETFNMFYISPYFDCTLPVLSDIYPLVPYPVFAIIYFIGFLLVGFIMFIAQKGIIKLASGGKRKADA